jgi:hypothetical protein
MRKTKKNKLIEDKKRESEAAAACLPKKRMK